MNKTIVFVFCEDFLVCAIEPIPGKFKFLSLQPGSERIPLYFYVDKESCVIHNNSFAKERFDKEDPNAAGDFYNTVGDNVHFFAFRTGEKFNVIQLLEDTLKKIKQLYYNEIKQYLPEFHETYPISTRLVFPGFISEAAKRLVTTSFQSLNFELRESRSVSEMILVNLINENLTLPDKLFLIVEAAQNDLFLELAKINVINNKPEYFPLNKKVLKNRGINLFSSSLASLMVEITANTYFSPLVGSPRLLEQESQRFIKMAETNLGNFKSGKLKVNINLSDGYGGVIVINKSDLDQKASTNLNFVIFEIDKFLESAGVNYTMIGQVIINGSAIDNQLFVDTFEKIVGQKKIVKQQNSFAEKVCKTILNIDKPIIVNEPSVTNEKKCSSYQETSVLVITYLVANQIVKISTSDPSQTGQATIREFKYLGDRRFEITTSPKSLAPGDIAKTLTMIWEPGKQIELEIERQGKKLGIYRTSPIVKIEVGA